MEFAGVVYVNIDGKLLETNAYRAHRCDPEKIVAWQEYLATMVALKGPDSFEAGISAHNAASERNREKLYEFAMTVECSSCEAEVESKCVNLSVLKRTGSMEETRYPHPARTADAERKAREDAVH